MKTPYEVLIAFFNLAGKDADIYEFRSGFHYDNYFTYRIVLDDGRIYWWKPNLDIWEIERWEAK